MTMNNIDPAEFVEKYFGIELMEYQKILLRNTTTEGVYYLCFPKHCGYSEYKHIADIARAIFGEYALNSEEK